MFSLLQLFLPSISPSLLFYPKFCGLQWVSCSGFSVLWAPSPRPGPRQDAEANREDPGPGAGGPLRPGPRTHQGARPAGVRWPPSGWLPQGIIKFVRYVWHAFGRAHGLSVWRGLSNPDLHPTLTPVVTLTLCPTPTPTKPPPYPLPVFAPALFGKCIRRVTSATIFPTSRPPAIL